MTGHGLGIIGGVRGAIRDSKDAALGFAMRVFLNARLNAIGEVTELSLDTAGHSARVRLSLRDEPHPVDLHIRQYAIDEAEGKHWLTILDAGASRGWLEGVIRQFAVGRPFPVSATAARVLRLLT